MNVELTDEDCERILSALRLYRDEVNRLARFNQGGSVISRDPSEKRAAIGAAKQHAMVNKNLSAVDGLIEKLGGQKTENRLYLSPTYHEVLTELK